MVKRRIHIHGDGLDASASFLPKKVEEGLQGGSTATFTHPKHPETLLIHDDRGILMALVQGKLIHHQSLYAIRIEGAVQGLQSSMVYVPNRVPVQPRQLRDVFDGKDLNQSLDPSLQSPGESFTRLNPAELFSISATTVMAVHPMYRNIQPDATVQEISIPDTPPDSFVNQGAIAVTSTTPSGMVRIN
jgi:hypothetical protein